MLGLLETNESWFRNLVNISQTRSVKLAGRSIDRQTYKCIDWCFERCIDLLSIDNIDRHFLQINKRQLRFEIQTIDILNKRQLIEYYFVWVLEYPINYSIFYTIIILITWIETLSLTLSHNCLQNLNPINRTTTLFTTAIYYLLNWPSLIINCFKIFCVP